jgi:1-acyl-sn-glycerol-3-phosphate acyltransferase
MESENQASHLKPINIREVFNEKSPHLARLIPGFVFALIHRIMRLDFLNGFITRYGHLKGMDFVHASVRDFEISEEILGSENIPVSGSYIFAANHPLGGFDALLLMQYVNEKLGKLKFLVNDVLMGVTPLQPLFVPVNHHGSNSRDAARVMMETYLSGQQILIFPSGLASRKVHGKITDLTWQKHFISKAIEYRRDVIPVFISGRNSSFFYLVANWRKRLGIKWNLEMFLLPDETYRHRKKKIRLIFGEPIPYTTFDKSKAHLEWAEFVKNRVYELPKRYEFLN